MRWVIIRDPQSKFEPQAIFSTRTEATAKQIVEWFRKRWQVEVTFEESRRHLGIAHAETMVGQSHQSDNAVFVWHVFADYADGTRIEQGRQTENQKCDLVSQRGGDIFRCDWLRETTIMGVSEFSNIGKRGGNDKNTAFISGNPDRNALLCNLKWTKSS